MTTHIDDARLVAYLDKTLPAEAARALEAEIAADPALAARLRALDIDLGALRAEWDKVLVDAPAVPAAPSGSLGRIAAAAALAGLLIPGGALIGGRLSADRDDWRDYAAAYHLLYRPETLAAPMAGDGGVAHVSEVMGVDLSSLARIEGLDFRRAQVLGWDDQPLIQFAYLDTQGRPVAVCVMAAESSGSPLAEAERHGLPTASLSVGGVDLLVIGADGVAEVDRLALAAAARL